MGVIAIVEDDTSVRRALARLLRAHGLPAALFDSAEAYLAAAADGAFAVLVVDVALGRTSGLDLLESLAMTGAAIPTIVITARETRSILHRAERLGAPVVLKPIDGEKLLTYVSAALGRDPASLRDGPER